MTSQGSFIQRCLQGDALLEDIDSAIDEWHEGPGTDALHEHLGMTLEEYSLWVERPEVLPMILFSRRFHKPLPTVIQEAAEPYSSLAARAANPEEALEVLKWLRQTGRLA